MRDLLPSFRSLEVIEHQTRGLAAAPEISRYAAEMQADVLVMGTHGKRGLRRMLLGSVADEVVRTAPCPVLTLPAAAGEVKLRHPNPILVPIDFSDRSRAALEVARDLAKIYGSRLELLHVVQRPVFPDPNPFDNSQGEAYSFPRLSLELGSSLEDWARGQDEGPQFSSEILEGRAAPAIATHAKEIGAGLIVLSTHGLSGLRHFLLGSVSEGVVRLAECPVLTLRSPEDDS